MYDQIERDGFDEWVDEMLSDHRPASLSEAHDQWHAIHGRYAVCDLDCGATEGLYAEDQTRQERDEPTLVACGHCKGRHTVAGVRACSRTATA